MESKNYEIPISHLHLEQNMILTLCPKWRIDKLYLSLIFAILTPLLRMPKIYLLLAKIMLLLRTRAPLRDALQLAFTVH